MITNSLNEGRLFHSEKKKKKGLGGSQRRWIIFNTSISMTPQITKKSSVLLALPPYFFSVLVPLHTECHYWQFGLALSLSSSLYLFFSSPSSHKCCCQTYLYKHKNNSRSSHNKSTPSPLVAFYCLWQWFSKCGSWTGIVWELVRNAHFWAPS